MRYDSLVDVLRLVEGARDSQRNPTRVYQYGSRGVPCYVERVAGRELGTGAGQRVLADYTVFGPPAPPWRAQDRLQVRGGPLLEVQDLDPDVASRGRQSESLCATALRRS